VKGKFGFRLLAVVFLAIFFCSTFALSIEAKAGTSLKEEKIKISSPSIHKSQFEQSLTIEGTSSLSKIWLALRGPGGELTVYPVKVNKGSFKEKIWLRFGAGKYTLWAGDNKNHFNGKIRYEFSNTSKKNLLYLTPSGYVQSEDPTIRKLANRITIGKTNPLDKARAIHSWVTKNIAFDTQAYYKGQGEMKTAPEIIDRRKGICRDYAFVYASLARAANIPTRVVYGVAWNNSLKKYENHAWNQSYIDERWINVDTTWDAGYVKNKKFVPKATDKYFNPKAKDFSKTHKVTRVTLY
jgi:hypothetical protein